MIGRFAHLSVSLCACVWLLHCCSSRKEGSAATTPLLAPPVSRKQVRIELSKFPIPPEIGTGKDFVFEIEADQDPLFQMELEEAGSLPLMDFFDSVSWQCLTDTGEINIGAYDPSCVMFRIDVLRGADRNRFFGRDASGEELLTSKKADAELDRIAVEYAQEHCPWFHTLNERYITTGPFIPSKTREVWFLQKSDEAWCSSMCRVGVEFVTGRVVFYQQYHSPCTVSTKPQLHNAEEAAVLGMRNLHFKLGIHESLASLGINPEHRPYGDEAPVVTGLDALGCQRLVWYVMVEGGNDRKRGGCGFLTVDDRSGEVLNMQALMEDASRQELWKSIPRNPEPTIEKLAVLIDGRPIPVLFPPIKRGPTIFLFADCLKRWGISSVKRNGTAYLQDKAGNELIRITDAWDRRGLTYIPIEKAIPLLRGKMSVLRKKGKPSVSFILPRNPDYSHD